MRLTLAVARTFCALSLTACCMGGAAETPAPAATAPLAPVTPPPPPAPPVPEGPPDAPPFDATHCAVYLPPYDEHQFSGTATVNFQTEGVGALHFRNLQARCGSGLSRTAAYGGGTLRDGEGAEFYVCLPDGGWLRIRNARHQVDVGPQPIDSTAYAVELHAGPGGTRLLQNMLSNQYQPLDPMLQSSIVFGPELRSASGTAFVTSTLAGGLEGSVTVQIDCPAAG